MRIARQLERQLGRRLGRSATHVGADTAALVRAALEAAPVPCMREALELYVRCAA